MIKYWCGLTLLLFATAISAQNSSSDKVAESNNPGPKFGIKASATTLMAPTLPSLNIGLEYFFTSTLSACLEGGPSLNLNSRPKINRLRGYRLRAAVRKYMHPSVFDETNYYFELLTTVHRVEASVEGDFRRTTAIGNFRQRLEYDINRNRFGSYINFGLQKIEAGGFMFELGIGMGAERRYNTFSELPEDARFSTNGSNSLEYAPGQDPQWHTGGFIYLNLGGMFR